LTGGSAPPIIASAALTEAPVGTGKQGEVPSDPARELFFQIARGFSPLCPAAGVWVKIRCPAGSFVGKDRFGKGEGEGIF